MNLKKESEKILLIETATTKCSVGLAFGGVLSAYGESDIPNSHSAMLSVLIDSLIKENDLAYRDLDAVALSLGPGSYTGLRIGCSTAKGLCYALNIPCIGMKTTSVLAFAAKEKHPQASVVAMIDARRMEVYSEIFDEDLRILKPCSADILSENIYDEYLSDKSKAVLVGDGAAKTQELFKYKHNYFFDSKIELSARAMAQAAHDCYKGEDFLDTAYFEPFYLKNFIAAASHVKGLR